MPIGKGKTQIQVDAHTRDSLKKIKTVMNFSTYDDLIWDILKRSGYDDILTKIEEIEKFRNDEE